jgi:NADPH-dependent 2,4-dienoyl-CoA reductase/sulfur reductase-like enzyme
VATSSPTPARVARVRAMFVFKAAVVGAGVMGGEIAQVLAAATCP